MRSYSFLGLSKGRAGNRDGANGALRAFRVDGLSWCVSVVACGIAGVNVLR